MLLTIPEVAKTLGMDARTVRAAARNGTLPGARTIGHRTYVYQPDLLQWLHEGDRRQPAAI